MINEVDGSFGRASLAESSRVVYPAGEGLPWHYRAVVEWWPEFDRRQAEADALVQFVRSAGQPGLELGCGSGHRLWSCRRAGLDVDGCDASRGLIALCREQSSGDGGPVPRLYCQAYSELDLPRRYRSIYAGGVLGASGNTEHDASGLRRLYRLLEPGGELVLHHPSTRAHDTSWSFWHRGHRRLLGELSRPALELAAVQSRAVLRLSSRVYAYHPAPLCVTYTVRAERVVHGQAQPARGFALCQRLYSTREIRALLCQAGFDRRRIEPGLSPDGQLQLWVARKARVEPPSPRRGPLGPIGQAGAISCRLGM